MGDRAEVFYNKLVSELAIRGIKSRRDLAEKLAEKRGMEITEHAIRKWDKEGWPIEWYDTLLSVLKMSRAQAEQKLFLNDAERRIYRKSVAK